MKGLIKKYQNAPGPLPVAPKASKRYQGGTYTDPTTNINGYRESVTGTDGKWYQIPSKISLLYTSPFTGDSIIRETPAHSLGVNTYDRWASKAVSDPKEWEIMRRRWEAAKKAATKQSWHNKQ